MWQQMGWVAKAVAFILFFMSMWSFGVAIERIFTFTQARNQSKMYAPQVAKHLKEGRLKDAIALSSSKNYRYSHLAKVVLAGLQEYQFQQESGGAMSRDKKAGARTNVNRPATAFLPPLTVKVPFVLTLISPGKTTFSSIGTVLPPSSTIIILPVIKLARSTDFSAPVRPEASVMLKQERMTPSREIRLVCMVLIKFVLTISLISATKGL